jgi:hypothetical protein
LERRRTQETDAPLGLSSPPDARLVSVDEASGERWALALERLKRGETVSVADVGLRLEESGDLTAMAISARPSPRT